MRFDNRVTRDLGVEVPIVQAPMGWIARAQLAAAVSKAGALGIIETSSGELDAIRGVQALVVPALPGDVHDLAGLRQVGQLLADG